MAKPNPLSQGLESLSKPVPAAVAAQPQLSSARSSRGNGASRTPSRQGQTLIGGFFAPEVHRQLRMLAAEAGTTQQGLIAEALNMLFAKNGKPEIAALTSTAQTANA